jgi:hypothetical protein
MLRRRRRLELHRLMQQMPPLPLLQMQLLRKLLQMWRRLQSLKQRYSKEIPLPLQLPQLQLLPLRWLRWPPLLTQLLLMRLLRLLLKQLLRKLLMRMQLK